MARTTVNVTGDAMVATLIAKSEGDLDEATYNTVELVPLDDTDPVSGATK